MEYKYDVALSFAGEDRGYVDEVAECLVNKGVRIFYDRYEQVELWGKNLYTHLQDIYAHQARYTVMFISQHYREKLWTNHEREAAQFRAFTEHREYILPVRFDQTELPGFLPTTGYLDLNLYQPSELADLIIQKVTGQKPITPFKPARSSVAEKSVPKQEINYIFENNQIGQVVNGLQGVGHPTLSGKIDARSTEKKKKSQGKKR